MFSGYIFMARSGGFGDRERMESRVFPRSFARANGSNGGTVY